MTWHRIKMSQGTEHNVRVRGGGTWGDQSRRLYWHQRDRYRREMGRGTWSAKDRRLIRSLHQRERGKRAGLRRTSMRKHGTAGSVGALLLGAVLLMSPATRGAGLTLLVLAASVLYAMAKHKRA